MTDPAVISFLATQERFECKRLSANLTRKQCADNQRYGNVLSCDNCPGLGATIPAPTAPSPTVTLIFSDPVDLDLYYKLSALSEDLSNDIISLLHLVADQRLGMVEVKA